MSEIIEPEGDTLFRRVASILDQARTNVVRSVNTNMVLAYWLIGREIVQELQGGEERAGYGKRLLETLSKQLKGRYGKGFSATNLKDFRLFFQAYSGRLSIRHTTCDELGNDRVTPISGGVMAPAFPDFSVASETVQGFSPHLT